MNKIISLFVIAVILTACTTTGDGYMQQNELLAQINDKQAPVIVDVRSVHEYQSGHVPGAINIPFWTAFTTHKLDGFEKSEKIIIYCEHGPRAGIAKLGFGLSGFNKTSYLAGHMTAWKKAGLPMEKDKFE